MSTKRHIAKSVLASSLLGVVLGGATVHAGDVTLDVYGLGGGSGIPGPFVSDLTEHASYPDSPTFSSKTGDFAPIQIGIQWPEPFEESDPVGDEYGLRMQGYLEVPTSGEWKFFVRSDDGSSFRLNSEGADPSAAEEIAHVPGDACCDPFLDDGIRSSDPIELQKGEQYFFEFLLKENTGNDWGQVGWTGPGIEEPQVITRRYVQRFATESGPPEITSGPESIEVNEGEEVVLQAAIDALPPVTYQWKRSVNGDEELIDGATSAFYVIESASVQEHDGVEFTLEVSNEASETPVESDPATVTVLPDTTPPRVIGAQGSGRHDGIVVRFSEPVDEATATEASNYTILGQDVTVNGASLLESDRVLLDVSEYTTDPFRVQVSNVTDRSSAGNEIEADSEVPVALALTLRGYWPFDEGSGGFALDAAGGHPGTVVGETQWSEDVPSMGDRENPFALDFGGEGDAVFTEFAGIGGQKPRSVSFWIKVPETNNSEQRIIAWGNSNLSGGKQHIRINEGTQTIRTEFQGGNNWGSTVITDDTWHHVVSVLPDLENPNNDDIVHYVDGELDPRDGGGSQAIDVDITSSDAHPVTFARGHQAGQGIQDLFEGALDDIAIFEEELTEEEIAALANGQSPLEIAESLTGTLTITQQPQAQTVTELQPVTFSVEAEGSDPAAIGYRWLRNGEPVEGETEASWTLEEPTTSENDGDSIAVEVFNTDGSFNRLTSEEVVLTVEEDVSPPQIVSLNGFGGGVNRIQIRFDEPVDETTATDLASYTLEDLSLEGASLSQDGREVTLTTGQQTFDQEYTLTIEGVSDIAPAGNVLTTEAAFTSALSFSQEVLVDNPVRYWRMDDTSGMTALSLVSDDDDLSSAHGTYAGGPTLGAESLLLTDPENTAVNFDPGTHVDIPNGGDINVGGPYVQKTVEMWIRPDEILSSDQAQGLWEQGAGTRGLGLYLIGNEVFFNAWNNADDGDGSPWGSGTPDQDSVFVGGGNVQAGQPAHIVAVMDGTDNNSFSGSLSLYVNGELVDETEGVGQLYNHGGDVDIAEVADMTHTDVGAGNLNGTIDEVSLYNTALSAERVQAHFEAGFKGVLSGPATITKGPEDQTVPENSTVELTAELDGIPPYEITWFKNDAQVKQLTTVEPSSSLAFQATAQDNNANIRVEVSNAEGEATSREATLTVEMDTTPPQVTDITAAAGQNGIVIIVFDEQVDEATATDVSNYSIEGVTVTSARLRPDGRTVVLTTETQEVGQSLTLQISGVRDLAQAQNEVSAEQTVQAADLNRPLQAYWDFEEGEGATVGDRVNGNDGTLEGDPQWASDTPSLDGRENTAALEFDGDADFVQTPYAGIGGGNPRTVSFWIKTADTSTHGIVAWGDDGTSGAKYHIRVNNATGTVRTEVQGGNNWGSTDIVDDEWHHVASVVPDIESPDNLDVIHYVDGELDPRLGGASQLIDTDITSDDALPVTIGRRTQGDGQDYFTGVIDEVAIFNAALSAGQIAELASGQSPLNIVQLPEPTAAPEITIALEGDNVRIEFSEGATLQTAPSVTGQWEDSEQQQSPATFPVSASQTMFFRVVTE